MPAFSNWEPTLIGDKFYCDLKVRDQGNGKFKLMLVTKTSDSSIEKYSSRASSNGSEYRIPYDTKDKDAAFAVKAMNRSSSEITDIFRHYIKNVNSSKNLSVTLREAIGILNPSDRKFSKVVPEYTAVTGDGSEMIIYYDIVSTY